MPGFKEVFELIEAHYSEEPNRVSFFRLLFSMGATIPSESLPESSDERMRKVNEARNEDPLAKATDTAILNYIKRGKLAQPFAKGIAARLDTYGLTDFLTLDNETVISKLVEDTHDLLPDITKTNYAPVLAEALIDAVYQDAKLTKPTTKNTSAAVKQSGDLKSKWGHSLLKDAQMICSYPGCSRSLVVFDDKGCSQDCYEVAVIEPKKGSTLSNVIAMCPQCHAHFSMNRTKAVKDTLTQSRFQQQLHAQEQQVLERSVLEKGITEVVKRLANYRGDLASTADITMDPVTISEKIDTAHYQFLEQTVRALVTAHYVAIHSILQELHVSGVVDVDVLRLQIKALYLKLKDRPTDQIILAITRKLHQTTKQDAFYCQILVCYFVQTCDILEVAPTSAQGGVVYAAAQ